MNLLTMEHITKAYTDRVLLNDVAFSINENEKIGVIGINGMGKSTLLKVAAGIEPYDEGKISIGNQVKICYLPQTPEFEEGTTVLRAAIADNVNELNQWTIEADARSMLNKLGFYDYDEKVEHMSGGQKKRIALVNALLTPADILVLDEPTNHLDIGSKEMLEDALEEFDGTIIMVSHDRYLLNRIPTKIIEMTPSGYETYNGKYDYYVEHKVEPQVVKEQPSEEKKQAAQKFYRTKADRARQVAAKKRIAFLEQKMEENEQTIAQLTEQMGDPQIASDYQKVEEICQQIEQLKNESEAFGEEWLELSAEE